MIRSLLYVPAISDRFVAKAHERGADAIILDLEDAVAPADKAEARRKLAEAVPAVGRNGAKVFVRINSGDLAHEDAQAACLAGAYGLYVPKTEDPQAIADLASLLAKTEAGARRDQTRIVALIETAGAVLDARAIARAPRVMALTAGSEDLALDMGAEPTPEVLRFPKLMIHYAAKAEGLMSFGTLRSVADYSDHAAIEAAAREARAFGFDGASCVHPAIVPLLNQSFLPSAEQLQWARKVVEAAKDNPAGAFSVDGSMVDAPVLARARRLLE
jgi:citrate lyase subunit beta / citryl-CoA lyase